MVSLGPVDYKVSYWSEPDFGLFSTTKGKAMYRKSVNKGKSAAKFRGQVGKTKAINMRAAPMRGGIRL